MTAFERKPLEMSGRSEKNTGSFPVVSRQLDLAHTSTMLQQVPLDRPDDHYDMLSPLVSIWRGWSKGGGIPKAKSIRFGDLVGWHTHIALSTFDPSGCDPIFDLFGEEMAAAHGGSMKGQPFSSLSQEAFDAGFKDHFAALSTGGYVGYSCGRMLQEGRSHLRYQAVELPLADESGKVIRLLHGLRNAPLDE